MILHRFWKSSSNLASSKDHVDRTIENVDTYITPLLTHQETADETAELKEFIQTFNVSDRTDEIIRTLQDCPTVKDMFEALVPMQVSYEQFWLRYFFRCDANRIEQSMMDQSKRHGWSLSNPLDVFLGGKFDCDQEIAYRRNLEDVYTTPLLCDNDDELPSSWEILYELEETRQFLSSFDIEAKTDEISIILDEHYDTVRVYFEALVPMEITYSDFWARYFFRCDPDRVQRAWAAYQNHLQQERHQTIDTIVHKSTKVIVGPATTVWKTSFNIGSALLSTALHPVGVIANVASNVVTGKSKTLGMDSSQVNRMKRLQTKLVETKRKLRASKADASRLRNELMKAQDALHVRRPEAIAIIEDYTSSSAITEDSVEWSDEKDETSITASADGLSAGPHVPSAAIFRAIETK